MSSADVFLSYLPTINRKLVNFEPRNESLEPDETLTFGQDLRRKYNPGVTNNGRVVLDIGKDFFQRSKMESYLIKAIADTGGSVNYWDNKYNRLGYKNFESSYIVIDHTEPSKIIAAMCAAVKDNSAALGKEGVLFDSKAIEAIPHINQHLQSYLSQNKTR